MNAARRAHFADLLVKERARIDETLERIGNAPHHDDSIEPDHAPGDDGEAGAAGAAPQDDHAIAVRESAALTEVDEALRLLREDPRQYGICVACGKPIALARLELLPSTRYCERHAQ
jgi:RNA polymerase-binding transcription factor DksA